MGEEFQRHARALERMAQRRHHQAGMPEKIWIRDAQAHTRDFQNYQAIEWIDPEYRIQWVEPISGNEEAIGFNVACNELRQQRLDQAAEQGTIDYSGILELRQSGPGIVIYAPVGKGASFNGFIAGVFRLKPFAAGLVGDNALNRSGGC